MHDRPPHELVDDGANSGSGGKRKSLLAMVALRVIGTRCALSMTLRLEGGLLQSSSHAHSHRRLGAATVPASGMARTTPRMLRPAAVMRAGRHLIRPSDQCA